ncbi:hypothetical protein TMEN_1874 [Trichophyton mentagrophytes]|nr:hypothetical protein TMEN_1874 [Trichophyton mentagrophytes]
MLQTTCGAAQINIFIGQTKPLDSINGTTIR